MLSAARCKGVVVADYAAPNLFAVRDQVRGLQWAICLRTDEGKLSHSQWQAAGARPYEEIANATAHGVAFPGSSADSAMELIFTSGTTGDPKGIVMTHRRYVETSAIFVRLFGYQVDDRLYSGLSLTHANAQVLTLGASLSNAMPCVLSRRFTKSRLWDLTRKYRCTSFTLLGGMTTAIYAEPPKADDADNPVRFVLSAGMPAAIWQDFGRRFQVGIFEFYGAAEGGLCINPVGVGPVGSIGKPIPMLKRRIVDDAGNDCPSGTPGELLFGAADGSPLKVEYFGNPEASAKKCADGWLHTGDIVVEDNEGWLYFQCRKGNGIRRNGDFVNPAFIEKAIAESPDVDDVYVYGVASANGAPGEKDIVAAVVPKHAAAFDAQALFRQCRSQLEANFVPSFIQVLKEIPKTASEKPQDRRLLEMFDPRSEAVFTEVRRV
jgi:crotonobetaine/carnitine-CoA ligase